MAEFEKLKSGFTRHLHADVQLYVKRLGQRCIDNVITLINHFKPKLFYIENPKSSYMWKYITLNNQEFYNNWNCVMNEAWYGQYGFLLNKPTIFLSNLKMKLKTGRMTQSPVELIEQNGQKFWKLKDDNVLGIKNLIKYDGNPDNPYNKGYYLIKRFLTLSHLTKIPKNKAEKMTDQQIHEAGPLSYIPHPLIFEILLNFLNELIKEK